MTAGTTPFNPTRFGDLFVPASELHLVPLVLDYLHTENDLLPVPLHLTLSGLGPRKSPPSGWFSPSVHPTWPLRDLVMYAMDPASVKSKPLEPKVQISALMGSIWHDIVNKIFREAGILIEPPEKTCPLCRKPRGYTPGLDACNEHAVFDHVLKQRGHLDDVLYVPTLQSGETGIDVKTCAHHAIKSINNHDPAPYVTGKSELTAKYYGQLQAYMGMKDWQRMILLFVGMGFPWEVKEVVIERDQPYIDRLQEKYATAREMAARGEIPPAT